MDAKAVEEDLGTLGLGAYLWNPPLPAIIAEWTALIPLIVHLASSQSDYHMVGEAALEGRISTGLFPKLGLLDGIANLLNGGLAFLERASSGGGTDSRVWDVSWGSVFPCANGAARMILTDYALRHGPRVVQVEDWSNRTGWTQKDSQIASTMGPSASTGSIGTNDQKGMRVTTPSSGPRTKKGIRLLSYFHVDAQFKAGFRRSQTLHVIKLGRGAAKMSWRSKVDSFMESRSADMLCILVLLALASLLCLFGAYGTAVIVLSRATSRIACHCLPIERPPGYLVNNETHDACMLTAIHENASSWFLYTGDRAVVDWLLNKTMISVRPSSTALYHYFRFSHLLQLFVMTYVAAQKGWDGVCLFCLMVMAWAGHVFFGRHRAIEEWLRKERITFNAHSFELTGRTPMIGAIQLLCDNQNSTRMHGSIGPRNTTWMDSIVAPSTRRDIWTQRLLSTVNNAEIDSRDCEALSQSDRKWVENNTRWAIQAADCIEAEMEKTNETQA